MGSLSYKRVWSTNGRSTCDIRGHSALCSSNGDCGSDTHVYSSVWSDSDVNVHYDRGPNDNIFDENDAQNIEAGRKYSGESDTYSNDDQIGSSNVSSDGNMYGSRRLLRLALQSGQMRRHQGQQTGSSPLKR